MTRYRSRSRSRRLGGRSPLTAVREALLSLLSVGPSRRSGPSLQRSYRSGLVLSRDLLHLALIVACIRFALTGAFVLVVSSKLLLVFAFNLLVTVPGMYRLALHLGWVEEPTVGIAVAPLLGTVLGIVVALAAAVVRVTSPQPPARTARLRIRRPLRRRLGWSLDGSSPWTMVSLPRVRSRLPFGDATDRL